MHLNWERSKQEICRQIRDRPVPVKVVLKTKDERFLLERWIAHYSNLFGAEAIIIFDNGSTDPSVLDTYRRHSGQISIYTYSSGVDMIHLTTTFDDLYQALAHSSEYFMFFDTDEFLVYMEGGRLLADSGGIKTRIVSTDRPFYFGVWLQNILRFDNRFWLDEQRLKQGLMWGKPIVRSDLLLPEFLNHNTHIFSLIDRSRAVPNDFFLLHLNLMSPLQRSEANLRKLKTFRIISPDQDLASVLNMDAEQFKGNPRNWIQEIKNLSKGESDSISVGLPPGAMEILKDGVLAFSQNTQEPLLRKFAADVATFLPPG